MVLLKVFAAQSQFSPERLTRVIIPSRFFHLFCHNVSRGKRHDAEVDRVGPQNARHDAELE